MRTEADRLALRSRDGDRASFGRLYDLFSRRIYAHLYYRCFDREAAEDLTSSVFLKALEALPGYRPGPGGFSAWVYAIARNALTDHFRKKARTLSLEEPDVELWDLPDCTDHTVDVENRDRWERL